MSLAIREHFDTLARVRRSLGEPLNETETLTSWRLEIPSLDKGRLSSVVEKDFVDSLALCATSIGDPLTVTVSVANDTLPLDPVGDDLSRLWLQISEAVADIGTITLSIRFDKRAYIEANVPAETTTRTLIFVQEVALVKGLAGLLDNPADFEKLFWASILASEDVAAVLPRLNLLVPSLNGLSSGDYISIVGGDVDFSRLSKVETRSVVAQDFYTFSRAKERLFWEAQWFTNLTPRHLRIKDTDRAGTHTSILKAIDAHAINTSILYLASRSWRAGTKLVGKFSTDRNQFEVDLFAAKADLSQIEYNQPARLIELSEFAYQTDRLNDRLSFAQAAVSVVVSPDSDASVSAFQVAKQASQIKRTADWTWTSFCEERIEKYKKGTEDVEKDVRAAAEQFDSTTLRLVEDMSKAVLSTIGAIITAFLAAGLKKDVNARAFQVVLAGFFIYLVVVAGWLGMRFVRDRFVATKEAFQAKRDRHVAVLGKKRVDEIVGRIIDSAESRFSTWFKVSIFIYTLFAIGLLTLIIAAPNLLF